MENLILQINNLTDEIQKNHKLNCSQLVQKVCDILTSIGLAQKQPQVDSFCAVPDYRIFGSHKNDYYDYYLNNVNGASLFNVVRTLIDNLPTNYQKDKRYKKFLWSYEQLVLSVYPQGHIANSTTLLTQKDDFNLSFDKDHAPLLKTKENKENLITNLIAKTIDFGHLSLAISYYKKYVSLFFISARIFFCRNLVPYLDGLDITDLSYLQNLCMTEKRHRYTKKTFLFARKTLLCLVDSLQENELAVLSGENFDIKKHRQELLESFDIESIQQSYENFKETLDFISDNMFYLLQNNNQARYHLSVFKREYGRIFTDLDSNYLKVLNAIDDIFANRLANFTTSLSQQEQDRLLKDFCQSGINWLNNYPSVPSRNCQTEKDLTFASHNQYQLNFYKTALYEPVRQSKQFINLNDYFDVINNMPNLKKIIVGAQSRLEFYAKNNGLFDGDYTWLVVSQIKLVERYLKHVILNNNLITYKTRSGRILNEQLVASNNANIIDAEIGTIICGLQYHYWQPQYNNHERGYNPQMPWFLKGYTNPSQPRQFLPNQINQVTTNCPLYLSFTHGLRNGFFHVEVIKDFESAKKISAGVSYWLACCMKYYGVVNDQVIDNQN